MQMAHKFEMYSDARIAFETEIRKHHPEIGIKIYLAHTAEEETLDLVKSGIFDEGIVIGVVAAEFNIIMDGIYSREQIENMYTILFHKLRDSRKESIITGSKELILPPGIKEIH